MADFLCVIAEDYNISLLSGIALIARYYLYFPSSVFLKIRGFLIISGHTEIET